MGPATDTVTWKAPQKGFYKGTERHFSCPDIIIQLTLHIPRAMDDVGPFRRPKCGSTMSAIAMIRDSAEIRTIIACMARHGRSPHDEG